jgi:Spy/CpxP family protein refolding chaperone
MRIHALLAAAAALLLAAAPAAAQPGPGGHPGLQVLRETEQRPLELLMDVRDELQLTDTQVARLRQIALRLEQTNRPLRRQLVAEHGRWREQRRMELERMSPAQRRAELRRARRHPQPPVPEPLRPLVRQIRGNVQAAVLEAGTVLTPQQKVRARELLRERRAERMDRRRRGHGGRGPHGGPP